MLAADWVRHTTWSQSHLEDAVPLAVGQELSGYSRQLADWLTRLLNTLPARHKIASGGTGLNAPAGFGVEVAAEVATITAYPIVTAANKLAALGSGFRSPESGA